MLNFQTHLPSILSDDCVRPNDVDIEKSSSVNAGIIKRLAQYEIRSENCSNHVLSEGEGEVFWKVEDVNMAVFFFASRDSLTPLYLSSNSINHLRSRSISFVLICRLRNIDA